MGETKSSSALARYIEGDAIVAWLQSEGVRAFRYKANVPGAWFLVFSAAAAAALAGFVWYRSHLALAVHKAGFFILLGFALWCLWVVIHWGFFALRNYVGLSSTELLVGRGPRAYLIPLSRLNRDTVRMDRMQRGKYTSVLPIAFDDFERDIHLVGPFANLQHLQIFIGELLVQLIEDDEDGGGDHEEDVDAT